MRPERTTDVTAKCIYNRLKNTRIISTQGRARKFTPPPWYKGRGERDGGNPSPEFGFVTVLRNDFTFSAKPLIFLTR